MKYIFIILILFCFINSKAQKEIIVTTYPPTTSALNFIVGSVTGDTFHLPDNIKSIPTFLEDSIIIDPAFLDSIHNREDSLILEIEELRRSNRLLYQTIDVWETIYKLLQEEIDKLKLENDTRKKG